MCVFKYFWHIDISWIIEPQKGVRPGGRGPGKGYLLNISESTPKRIGSGQAAIQQDNSIEY